jgi:uncharacterized membrane protein
VKKRIWELDALRGLNVLGMIGFHFIYDITYLFPLLRWNPPGWYDLLARLCAVSFVLISGICATLGKHSIRRGLTVLGCGMIISAVTVALALTGLCDESIIIYFGILHCLGCCMLLWHFFKNASAPALCLWGALIAAAGSLFRRLCVSSPYLYPLGLTAPDFASADYFPLLPFFGFFLAGAALGRRLYPNRQSLFPSFPTHGFFRFLCACGRHSLWIYLLHQPILLFLIETALA